MNKNGAAIYNTRITKNYNDGNTWFTQNNTTATRYALVCIKEGEAVSSSVSWKMNTPKKGSKIKLLQTGETVKWTIENEVVKITIPAAVIKMYKSLPALAFSFSPAE